MTETGSIDWGAQLAKTVESYNNTLHTSIGMTPVGALTQGSIKVKLAPRPPDDLPKAAKGNSVRFSTHIGKPKDVFGKGYNQQWSSDIYTINSASRPKKKLASVSYTFKDSSGDVVVSGNGRGIKRY